MNIKNIICKMVLKLKKLFIISTMSSFMLNFSQKPKGRRCLLPLDTISLMP